VAQGVVLEVKPQYGQKKKKLVVLSQSGLTKMQALITLRYELKEKSSHFKTQSRKRDLKMWLFG
jgi:hypothetical protein